MQPGEPTEQYVWPLQEVMKITGIRAHRVLRGFLGNTREDEAGLWRKMYNNKLMTCVPRQIF